MGQRRGNVRFVEIVWGRHPDGINVRIGQEVLHTAVNAWTAMPCRERVRVLRSRSGGADEALPCSLESRGKDGVGEASSADQPPSHADRMLHDRDSKRTLQSDILSVCGQTVTGSGILRTRKCWRVSASPLPQSYTPVSYSLLLSMVVSWSLRAERMAFPVRLSNTWS